MMNNTNNTTTIELRDKNTAFVNGTLFTSRDYTLGELVDLIHNGTINYSQTTQRDFVYNKISEYAKDGKLKKSGALIRDIVKEDNIYLPPIIFAYNSDTGSMNIHDGKQRLLSVYYFCHPEKGEAIDVSLDGRKITWETMSDDQKDKLRNTLITVSVRKMATRLEEQNFYAINSNAEPLTEYEKLRGCLFGTFLTSFEDHMKELSGEYKNLENTISNRGKRSYRYLVYLFGLQESGGDDISLHRSVRSRIAPLRNTEFDEATFNCDHILRVVSSLLTSGMNEEKALDLAYYIVNESTLSEVEESIILGVYRADMKDKKKNDIGSWNLGTHKDFINSYFDISRPEERRHLDPMRKVPDAFFDVIAKKYGNTYHCQGILDDGTPCPCEGAKNMQMDHIIPWSLGGRTMDIDNLQFLCEKCNKSKGNRYEE